MTRSIIWLSAAFMSALVGTAVAADLKIIVNNVPSGDGATRVRIFDSAQNFGDGDKAFAAALQFKSHGPKFTAAFHDVPEGRYAVVVFYGPKDLGDIPRDADGKPSIPLVISGNVPFKPGTGRTLTGFDEAAVTVTDIGSTIELTLP